jgi:hypothetical protein
VDVAGLGRFHPARAGAGVRCGSAAALGASLRPLTPDTDPGPPHRFGAFGGTGDAREAAETLGEVVRKAERPPFWPSQTLPGPQKGRLSARRQQTRSFAMSFMAIAKLLVIKTQAKQVSCVLSAWQQAGYLHRTPQGRGEYHESHYWSRRRIRVLRQVRQLDVLAFLLAILVKVAV